MTAPSSRFRLLQLTDLHLGHGENFRLANIPTLDSFVATLDHAIDELHPDHVVLTGDLAANGEPVAYDELVQILEARRLPVSCLPGNHDDPELMRRVVLCHDREEVLAGWRLLLLNTAIPGEVGGQLADATMAWVAEALARDDARPILVFMHHPPLPVGCAWLDRQRVSNGADLIELLRASPRVKAVFTGHVHQAFYACLGSFAVYSAPSTCFQFTPNSDVFAIDELPPGMRVIDLYPDGRLETQVVHLPDYPIKPALNSVGY